MDGSSKASEYIKSDLEKGYTQGEICKGLIKLEYDSKEFNNHLKVKKAIDKNKESKKSLVTFLIMLFVILVMVGGCSMMKDWNINKHVNKGKEAFTNGDADVAIEEFKKVIELAPESPKPHVNLGFSYCMKGKISNEKSYHYKAIEEFNKGIELNSNYSRAYEGLGLAYYWLGDYDVAIQNLKKRIELGPEDPTVYSLIGWAYIQKDDYDSASEYIEKVIELAPGLGLARQARGILYYHNNQFDLAIEEIEQGKKGLIHSKARMALASSYAITGKDDLAEKEFKDLISKYPDHVDAYISLGELYLKQGNNELALENFKKAIELNPDSERAKENYNKVISKISSL